MAGNLQTFFPYSYFLRRRSWPRRNHQSPLWRIGQDKDDRQKLESSPLFSSHSYNNSPTSQIEGCLSLSSPLRQQASRTLRTVEFFSGMASYDGQRGPNVSEFIANLNTIPSAQDMAAPGPENFNLDDELAMFTNTQFFDFDLGQDADLKPVSLDFDFNAQGRPPSGTAQDLKSLEFNQGRLPSYFGYWSHLAMKPFLLSMILPRASCIVAPIGSRPQPYLSIIPHLQESCSGACILFHPSDDRYARAYCSSAGCINCATLPGPSPRKPKHARSRDFTPRAISIILISSMHHFFDFLGTSLPQLKQLC